MKCTTLHCNLSRMHLALWWQVMANSQLLQTQVESSTISVNIPCILALDSNSTRQISLPYLSYLSYKTQNKYIQNHDNLCQHSLHFCIGFQFNQQDFPVFDICLSYDTEQN